LIARSPAIAAVLGIAVLAGCGSHQSNRSTAAAHSGSGASTAARPAASTTSVPVPHGRVLLVFKRELGVDPLASYFTLYTSGKGVATVVYGGRDGAKVHNLRLTKTRFQTVKRLLRDTRLQNTGIADPNLYTYWVITPKSSHRLSQGVLPRSSRPLLRELNAIADANNLF
jgi:hypothetical protein